MNKNTKTLTWDIDIADLIKYLAEPNSDEGEVEPTTTEQKLPAPSLGPLLPGSQ